MITFRNENLETSGRIGVLLCAKYFHELSYTRKDIVCVVHEGTNNFAIIERLAQGAQNGLRGLPEKRKGLQELKKTAVAACKEWQRGSHD